jgi:putative transposase
MRFPRVKAQGQATYHCVSRFVHGLSIFHTSPGRCEESEIFLSVMRSVEAFSCLVVLTYVLIGNHFHLKIEVPALRILSLSEMLERIEAGFGSKRVQKLKKKLASFAGLPDEAQRIERLLEPYRKRMFDLSVFLKELKGRFAQSYNRRHKRYGALWAERFKSTLVEAGQALTAIAAYIDLNPVRARLCEDPKDYPYCGYAEAIANGSAPANQGLRITLGLPETASREQVLREYSQLLDLKDPVAAETSEASLDAAKAAQHDVEPEKRNSSLAQRLRRRIRHFTDGVVLGSYSFVQTYCQLLKEKLGYKRACSPKSLKSLGLSALWVFRSPRGVPVD